MKGKYVFQRVVFAVMFIAVVGCVNFAFAQQNDNQVDRPTPMEWYRGCTTTAVSILLDWFGNHGYWPLYGSVTDYAPDCNGNSNVTIRQDIADLYANLLGFNCENQGPPSTHEGRNTIIRGIIHVLKTKNSGYCVNDDLDNCWQTVNHEVITLEDLKNSIDKGFPITIVVEAGKLNSAFYNDPEYSRSLNHMVVVYGYRTRTGYTEVDLLTGWSSNWNNSQKTIRINDDGDPSLRENAIYISPPNHPAARMITRASALKRIFQKFSINVPNSTNFTGTIPSDVDTDDNDNNYYKYIAKGYNDGIVGGYPDGTFRPFYSVNRVEFIKMVINTLHIPIDNASNPVDPNFPDMDRSAWYYPYVRAAYNKGIIVGTQQGYLLPSVKLSETEADLILTRALACCVDPDDCEVESISMNQTVNGSWTSSCASTHRSGRYAKYYTFSVSSGTNVRIDLESSEDTYMFLLSGNGTNGSVVASDDDGGSGTNSRIERNLSSGTYTIEATTYSSGRTGSFTLSVTGGGTDTEICDDGIDNDGDGRIDCNDSDCSSHSACQGGGCTVNSISSGSSVSGSWTSSCASTHRSGKYAKYYTFTVSSGTNIRIDLESSEDTYMFLLSGNGTNGSVVASDDDGGSGTNSRIERNLSSGTYTIEATTYSSGRTGSFTLSVTGGGTDTEICDDGIDNDGDGRIDCNDSDCSSHSACQGGGCTVNSISSGSSVSGSWTSSCASTHRSGKYAKYYTFSVPSGTNIQIDLTSSADTYLYLLSGNGMNGSAVGEDDDGGSGTNSRISGRASCSGTCTYTIEATTYRSGTTGNFTLRLQ